MVADIRAAAKLAYTSRHAKRIAKTSRAKSPSP